MPEKSVIEGLFLTGVGAFPIWPCPEAGRRQEKLISAVRCTIAHVEK